MKHQFVFIMEVAEVNGVWQPISGTNGCEKAETQALASEQLRNWKTFGIKTKTRVVRYVREN